MRPVYIVHDWPRMAGTTISVTSSRPPAPEPRRPALARGSDPEIEVPDAPRDRHAGARRAEESPTLAPGQRVGAWRIEGELGTGGMASVYAVVHARTRKRAALKLAHASILGAQFTPDTFLREARLVNRIDHPGVIDVFATGTFEDRPYLVMERLRGRTLGERLDTGPMSREESLSILLEICEVLAAAHAAGVVHRDLKLDNVYLLARPSRSSRLKLLDWGVATLLGAPDPLEGMIAGTLTYVAPEQVRGDALTPASDVYALGVLAYQMLLGQPPFASPSDLELLQLHLRADPPRPRTLWPEISPALDELLAGMLAKLPAARPPLSEVTHAFQRTRQDLVPRATRDTSRAARVGTCSAPHVPVLGAVLGDVFGAPRSRHQVLGALLGLAVATASLGSMFG